MRRLLLSSLMLLGLSACPSKQETPPAAANEPADAAEKAPTAAEADAYAEQVNTELKELWTRAATAEWIKATYITGDTERNAATANEAVMAYLSTAIPKAAEYVEVATNPDTKRQLELLRLSSSLPAPSDPAKREELATTASRLEGIYGKGKYCGEDGEGECRDLLELSRVIDTSRNYDELLEAWVGWRTVSPPMRPLFERMVTLGNEGAREIGFNDLGDLWRSGYDMPPEAFEKETDRLWEQVQPLYEELHCYVRGRLARHYGEERVPAGEPIPAHLLGNMWAQEWMNIYPLMEPYPGQVSLDVTGALQKQNWDAIRMVKLGESFFTSLGLEKLPETFWERSQFTKPRDRDVVCHASAWDVTSAGDIRIKMCIQPTEEDLVTIHHELGHNYYYVYYHELPVLFQSGANDGFHEAVGDALTLSITPQYLKEVGLLSEVPQSEEGLINLQMKDALEKVAFLPFGKLIDQWRWDIFSGKVGPDAYNAHWWALREKFQGVKAPVTRTEADFDPGAKYHVPSNVPYTRYFLARILQFQFHKALCEAAGHEGPLHTCSIYGNEAAGEKLRNMLAMGASKPWPDALEALTGEREMNAGPLLEYFEPLRGYLRSQNEGQTCGWTQSTNAD